MRRNPSLKKLCPIFVALAWTRHAPALTVAGRPSRTRAQDVGEYQGFGLESSDERASLDL
jgi:hypothetical protein